MEVAATDGFDPAEEADIETGRAMITSFDIRFPSDGRAEDR